MATVWATIVTDANSPQNVQHLNNALVAVANVPADWQPPMIPTEVMPGIWGVGRPAPAGYATPWQFYLTPPQDPVQTHVDTIPGEHGWPADGARAAYVALGQQMLREGFTLDQVKAALSTAYNNAILNDNTEPPPPGP
jgi:hypothetical protein